MATVRAWVGGGLRVLGGVRIHRASDQLLEFPAVQPDSAARAAYVDGNALTNAFIQGLGSTSRTVHLANVESGRYFDNAEKSVQRFAIGEVTSDPLREL